MNRADFDFTMKDFEMFFQPLNDWQRDEYFEALQVFPAYLFKQAYKKMRDEYKYRRTPLPGEIKAEMLEALSESAEPSLQKEGCEECSYTGIQLHDVLSGGLVRSTAFPCDCAKGQTYQKSFAFMRKNKGILKKR